MLRGAIVGFGNVAQFGHWPGYAASHEIKIVAVVDAWKERHEIARNYSLGAYHSLGEIENDAIDFIDICTPPSRHAEPMLEAIARGWHVLCEKPLLLDPAVVATVRERARTAIVPAHNWKYAPIIRAATQRLPEIGKLRRVEITTLRAGAAASADASDWRRDPKISGGGILMDHGWHSIYLASHWFNETPAQVQARLHWPNEQSVESEASLFLEFPSGEARIELSWNAQERSNRIKLIGSAGEMRLDDDLLVVNDTSLAFDSALSAGSHHPDWFAAMLPDVIAAFREPEKSKPLFEEAATCLSVIRRAYEIGRIV